MSERADLGPSSFSVKCTYTLCECICAALFAFQNVNVAVLIRGTLLWL